mmetsp:Transcript_38215/g.50340  ORF Transcript_38215/g.50340 Transcript_38215/m.50340 type:complete len:219 (-) Transcript_38215:7-663(-)
MESEESFSTAGVDSLRDIILAQGKIIHDLRKKIKLIEQQKKEEVKSLRMALYENAMKSKYFMQKCKEEAIATAVAEVQRERSRVLDDYEGVMERSLGAIATERDEVRKSNQEMLASLAGISQEIEKKLGSPPKLVEDLAEWKTQLEESLKQKASDDPKPVPKEVISKAIRGLSVLQSIQEQLLQGPIEQLVGEYILIKNNEEKRAEDTSTMMLPAQYG